MLLQKNYKILSAWKKPEVDDYEDRNGDYIFVKKFRGLIQYPMGQYYSKLVDNFDKETLRMSGVLFAPKSVKFDAKTILRNIDGTAFAFFSIIPINQNIGMIENAGLVDHNEYRIEFLNKNISFPIDNIRKQIIKRKDDAAFINEIISKTATVKKMTSDIENLNELSEKVVYYQEQ